MSDAVLVDRPSAGIVRLTLNRPDRRNALDSELREALQLSLGAALAADDSRAVILTGGGGVFCAGGDVASMGTYDEVSGRARMEANHRLARTVAGAAKPVVAAVEGFAMGAGAGIALLADTIVVGVGAKIGFPFLRLGLVPDYGLAYTLPQRVGIGRARRMIFESRTVPGAEAVTLGLADVVVADADVQAEAVRVAENLARQPAHALALTKQMLRSGYADLNAALDAELMAQTLSFLSADHREGVAAFKEKRPPSFAPR